MRLTSIFALCSSAAFMLAGNLTAAPISLTQASPTYTYDILAAGGAPDPNATLVNLKGTGDASYYTVNNNSNGSLSYTVNLAANATNLNVSLTNLLAFGGTGSIVGTYTIDGGSPGTLFTDVTEDLTDGDGGSGTLSFPAHSNNIALDPAAAHTVNLLFAVNSTGSNNYQQQLMRHDSGGNGGPFVSTGTFVPEPASLGLIAAGLCLALRRRR